MTAGTRGTFGYRVWLQGSKDERYGFSGLSKGFVEPVRVRGSYTKYRDRLSTRHCASKVAQLHCKTTAR